MRTTIVTFLEKANFLYNGIPTLFTSVSHPPFLYILLSNEGSKGDCNSSIRFSNFPPSFCGFQIWIYRNMIEKRGAFPRKPTVIKMQSPHNLIYKSKAFLLIYWVNPSCCNQFVFERKYKEILTQFFYLCGEL